MVAQLAESASSIHPAEWEIFEPAIARIKTLKKERNAIVLAHNYQRREIYHGIADVVGDSLQLAIEASRAKADVIVMCGVSFMAETAKIVNPGKIVLNPDPLAGCSLADSITGADVRALREAYPGVPVVTYVNTSAEVKAESDVCCTSSNAVRIVESLGAPRVLCIPDEYLAKYVATQTKVEILAWKGHCEVHERFTGADLRQYRAFDSSLKIIAHPECPPDVLAEADFVGSTSGMIRYVDEKRPPRIVMITECSMSDNVAVQFPTVEFLRPCQLCPHMQRITLDKVLTSLETMEHRVELDPDLIVRARRSIDAMIARSA